nr:ribonuclease H-like domain, reverse transcriptase, RNA-dependent DNA polymerase [Tanacetum cinerariifolium]
MQDLKDHHLKAVKQVIRHIKGTKEHGIIYKKEGGCKITGYSDSSYGINADQGKGTTGIVFYFGESPITMCTQNQPTVALSSCESEFMVATGAASPEIPFVANGVTYRSGYYLVNGIYPELATLVKAIPKPADDGHKRILYKKKQESTMKDVKRAFGVLKKKWLILVNLTRALRKDRIVNMMYTCIILQNMIRKYKKVVISPRWFPEEAHQPEDMLRNEEQVQQVMRWIRSSQVHQNLRHDLMKHLVQNA